MTRSRFSRSVSASFVMLCCAAILSAAFAQGTGLTRAEVAAIKAKLVAVEKAMGGEPQGYILESEDFSLPTDFSPAQANKFWPISASVWLRYTDKAIHDAAANAEKAQADFQQRYLAAIASGNEAAVNAMMAEMMQLQNAAAMPKDDITASILFNNGSYVGIDPDGVLFEGPGVIALKDHEVSQSTGQVNVYFDPVALRETETLSKIELRTPQDGVSNRSGIFNVMIALNGTSDDIDAMAKAIDVAAVLAVIDKQ